MRSVSELITSIRGDTRNEDVPTATSRVGIADADIVRYMNYAQERCQAFILKANPKTFQNTILMNIVSGQEEYVIPDRIYGGERIVNVQFSPDGQQRNYYDLPEKGINYRYTYQMARPSFYIRRSGSILVNPIPTWATSVLRITYERQVDTLALKYGPVSAANSTSLTVTGITTEIKKNDFICVSKYDGTVMLRNALVTNVAGTTVTANVSASLVTGYTTSDLTSSDCYVTVGKYTTIVSQLPDICERYLEVYAGYKLFKRDSSSDDGGAADELKAIQEEILASYQDSQKDEINIQIVEPTLVVWGDEGY